MADAATPEPSDIGVVITGVGPQSTGHQIYKALRLGRRRYRLVVGSMRPEHLCVAPEGRGVSLPRADDPRYLQELARVANAAGARFIAPGSDVELQRVLAEQGALAQLTPAVLLANNAATVALCSDRQATAETLAQAGFRTPRTFDSATAGGVVAGLRAASIRYPVVLKPRWGGGGSANVFVAQDEEELRFFAAFLERNGSHPLVQEYVGDAAHEYTIGVLSYPDGSLAGSIVLHRQVEGLLSTRLRVPNRTGRAELGPTLAVSSGFTQGRIDDFPHVRAAAERIARAAGSTGPLNIQGRLDGDEFVVFEINPRFSGTTSIRAMAGWNEPEQLIDWHLGARGGTGTANYRAGTFIRALAEYPVAPPDGRG